MSDAKETLSGAAKQLLEIEGLLGARFMPADRNPLGEIQTAKAPAAGAGADGGMSREEKAAALADMDNNEVKSCTRCGLCGSRTNTVFGEVNPDADLVFVGEGPGREEDRLGRPFVGRAGELLDRMIAAMDLTRNDVYICNVIKCRAPENRNPMPDEVQACMPYLIRQLQIIAPKVIVTMGNPATQSLLETRTGITRMRGAWQSFGGPVPGLAGTAVMPTFHPAYLLRNYSVDARGKVWSDLQQVMSALGLKAPGKR